jgi:hypothetical protein
MITNLLKPENFMLVAKQCLIQAFDIVYSDDNYLKDDESLDRDEFWD